MKEIRFHFYLLALSSLLSSAAFAEPSSDAAGVFGKIRAYVVSVSSGSNGLTTKSGSGVIVGPNEVLSNCHVIEGTSESIIEFSDGERARATAGHKVEDLDLCTLIVATGKRRPVDIVPVNSMKVGQKVFALGNPLSLSATFSDGLISGLRKQGGIVAIQTTAPISPGSSGGGLFDHSGKLLGITTFTLIRGQSLNFALPAEYLRALPLRPAGIIANATEPLTFKGVPFGASLETFKSSFLGTECRVRSQSVTCRGGVMYLGRQGAYSAYFKHGRLSSVTFQWARRLTKATRSADGKWINEYDAKIAGVALDIRKKLVEQFGNSTKLHDPSGQSYVSGAPLEEWQFGQYQTISIAIRSCDNPLFSLFCDISDEPELVELHLSDKRYSNDGSPTKDF